MPKPALNSLIAGVLLLNVLPALALMALSLDRSPAAQVSVGEGQPSTLMHRSAPVGISPAALLVVPFGVGLVLAPYLLGRLLVRLEEGEPVVAPRPQVTEREPAANPAGDYLRAGTRAAGDFVILAHAREDLGLDGRRLEAAVAALREAEPSLELRVVAEREILRRPRL